MNNLINNHHLQIQRLQSQLRNEISRSRYFEQQATTVNNSSNTTNNKSDSNVKDPEYTPPLWVSRQLHNQDDDINTSDQTVKTLADKPNNYFKYGVGRILGCIQLRSLGISATAIPDAIEIVLKMYDVFSIAQNKCVLSGFIPSATQIRTWVKDYSEKASDIQIACELHHGEFGARLV